MTVLVGYLPTPEGEAAFEAGLAEARRRGEDLLLLNSPRSGAFVSPDVASADVVGALTARSEEAGIQLQVRQGGHEGDTAEEVLRVADEIDASVVVIGLRRRTPVGKLIMGSNAQRILLEAERPVLAVKPVRRGA
ncbi:universal stress protein [Kineococcus sp. SYSU DK003]|uniref:universal stress protein n=1 Tax=Kineococcus sp. SYSU DK003 TaxID=3383124 RepID=UPI003D7D9873